MMSSKRFQEFTNTTVIPTKKQNRKLKKLVKYAKTHSPRIAKLYETIGDEFTLQDLPVTNKQLIMQDFDNWTTASDFTLNELKAFTSNPNNAGEKFKRKYSVCKTSGSTGNPFFMAYNPIESEFMAKHMNACMNSTALLYGPSVFLFPISQHMISICSIKKSQRKYPLIKNSLILQESTVSTQEIIDRLNEIQPAILVTYTSSAELLAGEQIKGTLHLNLKAISVGGETISAKTRDYIQDAFQCKVRSIYACTEASGIAVECKCNHLHLHNTGLILEPVDEYNNPVPVGQTAYKLLVTVLYQKTVPLIRYELHDRVTVHNTPCPCGNKSPWLEVEGRSAIAPFIFKTKTGEVSIFLLALLFTVEAIDAVRRIQVVLHGYDRFECRIDFMEGADETSTFEKVKNIFARCFEQNNIDNVQIYLSDQKPQIDLKTGKFVKAYQIL
ncbi:MAG: hypothetical protein J6L77_02310 [Coprococcus sp.]|nr:hypothetical protein [Coprococcus sp.]